MFTEDIFHDHIVVEDLSNEGMQIPKTPHSARVATAGA